MKREDLQIKLNALAKEWRDVDGSTTDAGDDFFNACFSAVQFACQGQHWEYLEGFLRRIK